jgi:2-methylisocitrate lyase-like PEP mutase family enzyme
MGFPALATTSAGLARSIGKEDLQVTRDELVAHVADLTAFQRAAAERRRRAALPR